MVKLMPYVVACFETVLEEEVWSQESKTQQANGLLSRISSFEFVVALAACCGASEITKGLRIKFQTRGYDLYQASR